MERRKSPRYPLRCEVEAVLSAAADSQPGNPRTVFGAAVDVSTGGVCILADGEIDPSSVLACRFQFPGVPVSVPVLMQVRWVAAAAVQVGLFRIGLSFLL